MGGSSLKMVALIFNVFGLLGLGLCQAFVFPGSHESDECVSEEDALSCICKNRENIHMSASMNFDIVKIQVTGCGVVKVPFGAIPHLQLQKIIFSDINQLDIQPFALIGAQTLHTLQIEDIGVFNVGTHGFVGLYDVTNITIRNVSSMNLKEGAFGGLSSIENFLIESSNFGEIKNSSFILTNISIFSVTNSNVGVMESNSFLIHNAMEVLFQNCSIGNARNHSFAMAYVDSVTFTECNFGILETNSIYLKYPASFNFESCTVSELNTYAIFIQYMPVNITFSHNVIMVGYEYPLYLDTYNSDMNSSGIEKHKVYTCCNSFLCDCNIYWMWIEEEPFYDFKTSFCIGSGTSLTDMTPILDSRRNCKTLEKNVSLEVNTGNSSHLKSAGIILNTQFLHLVILFWLTVFMHIG